MRKKQEIKNWFPDFGTLSFFRKIEIGISSTVYPILFKNNVPMLFLSSTLLIIINTFKNNMMINNVINSIKNIIYGTNDFKLLKLKIPYFPNIEYRKEIFGYKSTKYFPKTPKTNVLEIG